MKILGLIPARSGSKGVPGKNTRLLGGKPLFQHAFDAAMASGIVDRIVLSTDDIVTARMADAFGVEVPCLRPAEFAHDDSPMIDVVLHMLEHLDHSGYRPDAVLLLQPTSPLRTPDHLRRAVGLLADNDAVCSVVPVVKDVNPYSLMKVSPAGYLTFLLPEAAAITRRQDLPTAWRRDGTVFLTRVDVLVTQRSFYGTRCVPMPLDPDEAINIDTIDDWNRAEARVACDVAHR
jgi:CMP-N,N'-diacetyllegionaminic acid synthase